MSISAALRRCGQAITAHGPVGQGDFLLALGLAQRAEALKARADARPRVEAATARLTVTMGALFKALALTGRDWPTPAGFGTGAP